MIPLFVIFPPLAYIAIVPAIEASIVPELTASPPILATIPLAPASSSSIVPPAPFVTSPPSANIPTPEATETVI